ncbi:hypothetical protein ACSQ67_023605 [Phaseolus vulgaris]
MRSGNSISVRLDLNRNLVLVLISIVVFLLISLSINPMLFVRWPGLEWGQTERNAPFEIFPLTPFSTCGLGMSRSRLASSLCGFGRVSPFNGGSRRGQPAANPAEERESSTFSKASVNQQPVIPELEPTLLDENTRRAELALRLRSNWWGIAYNERILDSFVRSQLAI